MPYTTQETETVIDLTRVLGSTNEVNEILAVYLHPDIRSPDFIDFQLVLALVKAGEPDIPASTKHIP